MYSMGSPRRGTEPMLRALRTSPKATNHTNHKATLHVFIFTSPFTTRPHAHAQTHENPPQTPETETPTRTHAHKTYLCSPGSRCIHCRGPQPSGQGARRHLRRERVAGGLCGPAAKARARGTSRKGPTATLRAWENTSPQHPALTYINRSHKNHNHCVVHRGPIDLLVPTVRASLNQSD